MIVLPQRGVSQAKFGWNICVAFDRQIWGDDKCPTVVSQRGDLCDTSRTKLSGNVTTGSGRTQQCEFHDVTDTAETLKKIKTHNKSLNKVVAEPYVTSYALT